MGKKDGLIAAVLAVFMLVSVPVAAQDAVADWSDLESQVNINTTILSSSAGLIASTAPGDNTAGWGGWNNADSTTAPGGWRIRWKPGTVLPDICTLNLQMTANKEGTYLISRFGMRLNRSPCPAAPVRRFRPLM